MPWFITAVISKKSLEQMNRPRGYPRTHTFGFFNKYNDAYDCIKKDNGGLCECLYDYLVLEYIEEGIHPTVHIEYWWQWGEESNKWLYLGSGETSKPNDCLGICNWALG